MTLTLLLPRSLTGAGVVHERHCSEAAGRQLGFLGERLVNGLLTATYCEYTEILSA
jgi:hypothetical protein